MHGITILFFSLIVSCVPLKVLFSGASSSDEEIPDYKKLNIFYYLAFEKRVFPDYAYFYKLDEDTQRALDAGGLDAEQRLRLRRLQHKLRSFVAFALAAVPLDENGLYAESLSAMILDRLRTTSEDEIDLERVDHYFYRQVREDNYDLEKVSDKEKQKFFKALIDKSLEITEKSVRKYYRLFPFSQQSFVDICNEFALADCQHLQLQHRGDRFQEQPFASVAQVTVEVNKAIRKINSVIADLNRLDATKDVFIIFKETNFDDMTVLRHYHRYERALAQAAQRGFLPVLFAPAFRARAGNPYLERGGIGTFKIRNTPLTAVTDSVIVQSIAETQREIIRRWLALREIQRKGKGVSDKKLYHWIIDNDVAVAQVLLQEPTHSIVVAHLLNQYQDKNRDPQLLNFIRTATMTVEFLSMPLLFGGAALLTSAFPVLAGVGLVGKAIIAVTAANFVWVGVSAASTVVTQQRWLRLERSLLSGTSARVNDNLKLLREFHKTRRDAIIAGTIGLPLSVPSIKYALNHMYDGTKVFFIDMVAGVFSAKGDIGYEEKSDTGLHFDK